MSKDKEEKRTVRLQAMVTPSEAAFIRKVARDNGIGVSDLIREMLIAQHDD